MKLIVDNLPMEGEEKDGSVEFIHEGYYYNIGTLDGILWISRQSVEDYENNRDNWEEVERWIPEHRSKFRFLRDNKPTWREET